MKNSSQQKLVKKVFIASDHAGFLLKSFLIAELEKVGCEMVDLGCNSSEESVDYPDFAQKLSSEIKENSSDLGILICGSGVGISIAANRFKHIRAALCSDAETARLSRAHNNANVLCLGARFVENEAALEIAKNFLNSEFEGGRHEKRVNKLS